LGGPQAKLADGTWLYSNFETEDGIVAGTLIVRFKAGRVSELVLASPAAVVALRSIPKTKSGALVATE
jgi:hypothetical protein